MTKTRIILLIFGALAVFMIGFTYFYAKNAYPSGECLNTELFRLLSPSGEFEAVLFERTCGGDAVPSAHLSILSAGTELENAFGNGVIVKGLASEGFGPLVWSENVLAVKLNTSEVLSVTTDPVPGIQIVLAKG